MKILVTGAGGFIGRNLCAALANIRDKKDRREAFSSLLPLEVYECHHDVDASQLIQWCASCDFVIHLAGVNRTQNAVDFTTGNVDFLKKVIDTLEQAGNTCPIALSSSVQATLEGRFAESAYGKSKQAAERLLEEHARRTHAQVLMYRFANVYGKWCRPNYNSVVATFCYNVAHGLPLQVNDPCVELDLLYIDDVVEELLRALVGRPTLKSHNYCEAGPVDHVTVDQLADLVERFGASHGSLDIPNTAEGSFEKKLYSTFLSYLEPDQFAYRLKKNEDARGSFTEILHTTERGQISVNISKPGITKGQHWHQSKWEKFCVVAGEALIRIRRVGVDDAGNSYPVVEYRVSGEEPMVVEMAPGYTHSIANISDSQDLVTVMWANEVFDPTHPDTYYEEV